MQAAAPPPTHRLHWIPVEPSWIISAGLILLAVLPHQVPLTFRQAIRAPLGALLFAAASVWVWTMKPVLGTAMGLFLAGVYLFTATQSSVEGFNSAAPQAITKDRVTNKHRWYQEVAMHEKPRVIQERTEEGRLLVDTVTEHDATPWHDEPDGAPHLIQERPVAGHSLAEHDEDLGSRD